MNYAHETSGYFAVSARYQHRRWSWRGLCAALAVLTLAAGARVSDAQEFFTLKGHGGPIKGIAAGADGTVVTASFDNSVGVWRERVPTWLEGHEAAVNAVACLSDGRVVSAGDDFSVRVWEGPEYSPRILGRHLGKVIQLEVSPDGTRVASASWDRTARIWTLMGNTPPVVIRGHGSSVNDVAFSPDGSRVYTASADGTIRVWDAMTGQPVERLVHHGFGVNTLAVSHDMSWIAYGAVDGTVRLITLPDGRIARDFTADRRPILAMAYHPGIARIAVGDAQGYIMMIDTQNWRIVNDFRAAISGPIWALAFSPDGRNIHAGGLDTALYSWPVRGPDTDTGRGAEIQMASSAQSFLRPPEEMSNGERQFQRKCSICHALGASSQRRAGPTLFQIFGRAAGSVADYPYSQTLQNSDIVWSEESIDKLFDLGPDHYIAGTKMPMQRITKTGDRADLIAYLKRATAASQH